MSEACWHQIGVFGDSSCVELTVYHHCNHCPVYTKEARKLLDQQAPEDYLKEWTSVLARQKEEQQEEKFSFVLFRIGTDHLGLPTKYVREIVEVRPHHRIPHRSNHLLLGMMNIRGNLHLYVDLAAVLTREQRPIEHGRGRIMVIEKDAKPWAIRVDEILGVQKLSVSEIIPLLDAQKASKGMAELQGRTYDLLDEQLLFERLAKVTEG